MVATQTRDTVALTIPKDTQYLSLVRQVTSDLARRAGFADCDLDKIEMAVDEACANCIVHQSVSDATLAVEVQVNEAEFSLTLRDEGQPYPFEELGGVDLENWNQDARPGGLGLFIIKNFMDEVDYEHRVGEGNVLRMKKFVH